MLRRRYIAIILVLIFITAATGIYYYTRPSRTIHSGFRAMGWRALPPNYWASLARQIASSIPGTSPAGIWIVGRIEISPPGTCALSFPSSQTYPHMFFENEDWNEEYLTTFDRNGIGIWLQVEPGFADIGKLIDLVLERYGHHQCVLGFGIDLEWRWGLPDTKETIPVTDAEANEWLNKMKSHNKDHRLFLKHWKPENMPPITRKEIVFIDDAQSFDNLDLLTQEFKLWGESFSQNDVGYQVGYRSDREWWSKLENPTRDIGSTLIQNIPNCRFIFWTDETIHDLFQPS